MKVMFYCNREESDVYDYPDYITHGELMDDAAEWVADNVPGYYMMVNERDEDEQTRSL